MNVNRSVSELLWELRKASNMKSYHSTVFIGQLNAQASQAVRLSISFIYSFRSEDQDLLLMVASDDCPSSVERVNF
jgi:hypothetical protein